MHYDLWDIDLGKYLGRFTDQDALLTTIRTLIDHYGPAMAESLSVGRVASDGSVLDPITGDDLLAMVSVQRNDGSAEGEQNGRLMTSPGRAIVNRGKALAASAVKRG